MLEDYVVNTTECEFDDESTVLCDIDFKDLLSNEFFRSKKVRDDYCDEQSTISILHFTMNAVDDKDEVRDVIADWVEHNPNCMPACDEYIKIYKDVDTKSYLVIVECKPYEVLNELNEALNELNEAYVIQRKRKPNGCEYYCDNVRIIDRSVISKLDNDFQSWFNTGDSILITKKDIDKLGYVPPRDKRYVQRNQGGHKQLIAKVQSMVDEIRNKKSRCTFAVIKRNGKYYIRKPTTNNVNQINRQTVNVKVKGKDDSTQNAPIRQKSVMFVIVPESNRLNIQEVKHVIDKGLGNDNNIDNLCRELQNMVSKNGLYFKLEPPPNGDVSGLYSDTVPCSKIIKINNSNKYLYFRIVEDRR